MSIQRSRLCPSIPTVTLPAILLAGVVIVASSPAGAEVRILDDRVEPPGGVAFATNSAQILQESHPALAALAAAMENDPSLRIEVQVHSDSRGSSGYNLRMSHERAQAIVEHLLQLGIPAERLTFRGYGETCPVATARTATGRRQNRRIVFFRLDSGRPRPCPAPPIPPPPQPDPVDQFPDPNDAARQMQ